MLFSQNLNAVLKSTSLGICRNTPIDIKLDKTYSIPARCYGKHRSVKTEAFENEVQRPDTFNVHAVSTTPNAFLAVTTSRAKYHVVFIGETHVYTLS